MIITLTHGGIDPTILSGCCGTDQRDIEALAKSVQAEAVRGRSVVPLEGKFLENVTILGLPWGFSVLHIVCPQGRLRYYLLLTGIHRLLAPLFTIIRIY